MIESKYHTSPGTAVKKHRSKLKTYWCAPRKVRSINSSNQLTKTEKPKKRRRKKTRNITKKLKHIDIVLGQSKQNHRSDNVMESDRKCKIAKSCSTGKGKSKRNSTTKSKIRNSSGIVLPKKLGDRLFSLDISLTYLLFGMEVIWKSIKFKYIFACILITFVISCLISIAPISIDECKCEIVTLPSRYDNHKQEDNGDKSYKKSVHRLAILVPFRDRFEELLMFAPHMKKFLDKQNIDYHIFILNQVDRFRFNRASLINVGFLEVNKEFDYIAMHDVDLLPINDELLYSFPTKGPYHISSPELHPRYHYPTFVGGILIIRREHFTQVNGMSNKYWGWGLEDDEFYVRLKEAGLTVTRPQNISTGTHNTFKHIHDRNHRKRDMVKCYNQREITRKRDRQTGLNNVSYKILGTIKMSIGDTPLTVLNISLMCDKLNTPWCECDKLVGSKDGKSKEKKKGNNNKSATGL